MAYSSVLRKAMFFTRTALLLHMLFAAFMLLEATSRAAIATMPPTDGSIPHRRPTLLPTHDQEDRLFTLASAMPQFTTLYTFGGTSSDGVNPRGNLVLGLDGDFYGTTEYGGTSGDGTVFKITSTGMLIILYSFTGSADGDFPSSSLVLGPDGYFYGTTTYGGTNGTGTIFKITSSGILTTIHAFSATSGGDNADGANPYATLIVGTDGNFYGTALSGGTSGYGTVFKTTPAGALTTLHSFTNGNDGANPFAALLLDPDGSFYGTTSSIFASGSGTVFKITPSGTLTTLHTFTSGSDGASPVAALVVGADGSFYGTAYRGGTNSNGTVFKITPSGTLTTLHMFANGNDGANPFAPLILGPDGNFYGTTYNATSGQYGTLFKVTPTGTLTTLHAFTNGSDGANPEASLLLGPDGSFYGTTNDGSANGDGTIFRLAVDFQLPLVIVSGAALDLSSGGAQTFTAVVKDANGNTITPTSLTWSVSGGGTIDATTGVFAAGSTPGTYTVTAKAVVNGVTETGTFKITITPSDVAFTSLYNFPSPNINTDGGALQAGLTLGNDGDFYGTTLYGGSSGDGTIFKLTPAGTLTTLLDFNGSNGANPNGGLTLGSDGNFYGTTSSGGDADEGTVFKITLAGTLTTLISFNGTDGADPEVSLVKGSDNSFYGATYGGGSSSDGTVFNITPTGTLTTLFNFTGTDGKNPDTALVEGSDGDFYGTTTYGGSSGAGTVFKITSSGTLTTLVNFNQANGSEPYAESLIQGRDGNFYGTTFYGGSTFSSGVDLGTGTVFKMTSSGTLTTLYNFSNVSNNYTNGDGAHPISLIQGSDGNFYGAADSGGSLGYGTVFKMTPSGALTTLLTFTGNDGANPGALPNQIIQSSDGSFYETTTFGGSSGNGTVFKMTPAGQMASSYSFSSFNSGGGPPSNGALVQGHDGNFYGTASIGGLNGNGTVYKITPTGTVSLLYNFTGVFDGANPYAGLTLGSDGDFYGATNQEGFFGAGTMFKTTSAGALDTLTTFGNDTAGAEPYASLVQGSDRNFYGTTYSSGGSTASGTVFKATPTGAVTTLVNFNGTNGASPYASLVQGNDGNFYGTTYGGGTSNYGTIFKVTSTGTLTTLVNFTGTNGANPYAGLIQGNDGNFYGTTAYGGSSGDGTVFKVTSSGSLTTLVDFTNASGTNPYAGLVQGSDGNLYGTTQFGGSSGDGTIFQTTPQGTLTTLFTFTGMNGAYPIASLVQSSGSFYGTTSGGGETGSGTVYTFAPLSSAPTITSLTPTSGPVGTTVTITGTNLTGATVVGFQNAHAASFTVNGAGTQITTTVPSGAATGPIAVLTPGGEAKSTTNFTVTTAPQKPTITSFTPASGPVGTMVTIIGTNFTGTTVVGFQGEHATSFTVNSQGTQITTTVPSGAATGPIAVLTPGGEAKSVTSFTVTAASGPPTITSFTPTSGSVGATVTIAGTNLTGTTVVGFQNAHATSFTVNSNGTQITTTVPSGAVTGPIAVLTPNGEAKSATSFTVTTATPIPTITSFSPTSGSVGATVVITGTNLTGTTVVGFQGAHAASFMVNGAGTQITTKVPSGAATGPIAVLTPGGEAKSTTSFTVTP